MADTKIEWTDAVWNPVRGCSRISRGCEHCYAERIAARFSKPGDQFYRFAKPTKAGPRWTGRVELIPSRLDEPLRWRKPHRVFVNSMSDLFHEALPDEAIDQVFAVMALAQRHTFQILTKRPTRMLAYLRDEFTPVRVAHAAVSLPGVGESIGALAGRVKWGGSEKGGFIPLGIDPWPLPNVWLGVSVEDQATADERIPLLLQTPAAVRWVSYEPALAAVDFSQWLRSLSWIVVGGESGPRARPMHPDWPASVRRQCRDAGVAFFMKQRGAWAAKSWGAQATGNRRWGTLNAAGEWLEETTPWNGRRLDDSLTREEVMVHVDGKGGDPAEWPEDLRVRQFPESVR